jgi:DNA-binding NarL/FixJ family response regulator
MLEFRVRERHRAIAIGNARAASLTRREWDVLGLMADGASTRAMAETLGISAVTVRRHVSGVLAKLGVSDRAAAVAMLQGARDADS